MRGRASEAAALTGLLCALQVCCGSQESHSRSGLDAGANDALPGASDSQPDGSSSDAALPAGDAGTEVPIARDALSPGDASGPADSARWTAGALQGVVPRAGYVDSPFVTLKGDRLYFLYGGYSASTLQGTSSPQDCPAAALPSGHITAPGLDWNTDLYYAAWDGQAWSGPFNVGAPVNTLGMECCVWVNRDETEMIFYRDTDLDGDGRDGDLGLPATGNYRSARAAREDSWGNPVPLEGAFGTEDQKHAGYRHDIHKTRSGDYYLWGLQTGEKVLLYGAGNGSGHAAPARLPGTENEDTQVWVDESETVMLYNHRETDATTSLRRQTRTARGDLWSAPATVATAGFSDPAGRTIWGEPALDESASFMVFVRFDTSIRSAANPTVPCWGSQLMVSIGTPAGGFAAPKLLNP